MDDAVDNWHSRAACSDWLDVFDETFDAGSRTTSRIYRLAADVCQMCPVRRRCLADAMDSESRSGRYGMRGGLMPVERNQLAGYGAT